MEEQTTDAHAKRDRLRGTAGLLKGVGAAAAGLAVLVTALREAGVWPF